MAITVTTNPALIKNVLKYLLKRENGDYLSSIAKNLRHNKKDVQTALSELTEMSLVSGEYDKKVGKTWIKRYKATL